MTLKFTFLALALGFMGQAIQTMDVDDNILHTYDIVGKDVKHVSVVSEEYMNSLMGEDLLDLHKCPTITFHSFNPDQQQLYTRDLTKMVEFTQGEARFIAKFRTPEDRSIYSSNIRECVGVFIWKEKGPSAFAHFDHSAITQGRVERLLARFDDQTSEAKKSFQVNLISTKYTPNIRHVYQQLKKHGFTITGKAIYDMYDQFDGTLHYALTSLDIPQSDLKNKVHLEITNNFITKQNIPKNCQSTFILAATLNDGKLYNFVDADNLINLRNHKRPNQDKIIYTYSIISDKPTTTIGNQKFYSSPTSYYSIISQDYMNDLMGQDLLDLQKVPPITFHDFNNGQIYAYTQNKAKIVEFHQTEAWHIATLKPTENRLIFSPNIMECVGVLIWKKNGPIAFAHFSTRSIADGKVERLLGHFANQTPENKKLYQVSLVSTRYSENVRKVYSCLKKSGFSITGKAIYDMYSNLKDTNYIAHTSLDIPPTQLNNKTPTEMMENLKSKQNIPPNNNSFTFSVTLSDGKFYKFLDTLTLVDLSKENALKKV